MDLHVFLRRRSVRLYPLVFFLLVAMLLLSPDTLGKTAHAQGMNARVATATVPTPGIWKTNEAFVNTLYEQALGREPDAAGYAGWVSALEPVRTYHLSSAQYVAESFFSTEYAARNRTNTQYVDDLYNAILQRTPDAAGEAGWIASLDNGGSRDSVFYGFIYSPEFANDVNGLVKATTFTVPAAGPFPFTYTVPAGQSIQSAIILTPGGQTYYDPSDGANDACPSSLSSTDGNTVVDNNVDTDDGTNPDGTGSCTYSLAASATSKCVTAHVEVDKRNGDSDANTIARYVMNKKYCYDGTKVTQSDAADVRGYVIGGLISTFYEFKGSISTQNGSSIDGSSTSQGNFALKLNVSVPPANLADLGLWQPTITIVPHSDGSFDYAPSSGYTGTDGSTIHDLVQASFL